MIVMFFPFEQHFSSARQPPSLSHRLTQVPTVPSVLGQVPGWTTVWKRKQQNVIVLGHLYGYKHFISAAKIKLNP